VQVQVLLPAPLKHRLDKSSKRYFNARFTIGMIVENKKYTNQILKIIADQLRWPLLPHLSRKIQYFVD
jgi:hypothetical protein